MESIDGKELDRLMALARNGDHESQWHIGYYHEYGAMDESGHVSIAINVGEALTWYAASARQGNASAALAISNILSEKDGFIDYPKAIFWAKEAVDRGEASAAYNLGIIYRDLNKAAMAFRWYARANMMGDRGACLQIGLCYAFGFGIEQDLDQAYRYFEQVIENESDVSPRDKEDALYWMAVLQLIRPGSTRRSIDRARKMLEWADQDSDHEQAERILCVIGRRRKSPVAAPRV